MEELPARTTPQRDSGAGAFDFVLMLAGSWRALLFVPLVAGIATYGVTFLLPPTYTAVTRILPPTQQHSPSAVLAAQLDALAALVGPATGIKNPADQYVALLRSRTVLDAIVQKFDLKQLYSVRYNEDARTLLEQRTRVTAGIRDGLIVIDVEDRDPGRAARMANAFVAELRSITNVLAIGEAAQRRLFFQSQLEQAKDNLTSSEIALRNSAVSAATLRTVPQSALDALARLKAQITAQEIKLSSMRTFMTESNPELKLAVQELGALRGELYKAEQGTSSKAGGEGAEYIAKYRDFKYHETLFELMAKQYELARIDEAREGAVIQVVDEAQPPERRSGPRRGLISSFTAVTAFFGMILVVAIRDRLHNLARDTGTIRKLDRVLYLVGVRRL